VFPVQESIADQLLPHQQIADDEARVAILIR
jgi:hypothetical protein